MNATILSMKKIHEFDHEIAGEVLHIEFYANDTEIKVFKCNGHEVDNDTFTPTFEDYSIDKLDNWIRRFKDRIDQGLHPLRNQPDPS